MVRRKMFRLGAGAATVAAGLALAGALASTSGATVTTPGAPTALAAALGRSIGEVRLSWTAPADTGGGIATYMVSEATVSGGVTGSWSEPVSLRTTGTRATRFCGANYPDVCAYRVYAQNSAGRSSASNSVQMAWAAPSAATRLRAVPVGVHDFTANDLTWAAPARTGGLPVTYDVQIRVDSGSWTTIAQDLAVRHLDDDANCTGGTSCLYRVRAKNAVGFGPNSNSSALAVRPTGVTDLAVAVTAVDPTMGNPTSGASTVTVTWAEPRAGLADGSYQVAGCLDVCDATHGTWTSPISVANATHTLAVPCAAEYRTCTYRVRATNTLGGVGAWLYRTVSPFAPRLVSAATGSAVDTIDVTFNGVAETGTGAIGDKHFAVWTCASNCSVTGSWTTDPANDVALATIAAFPATAPVDCVGGTACQVRLQFVDGNDNAGPLSTATGAVGAELPGAPASVSAVTGSTAGTIDVTWAAPAVTGTPALTTYETRYSTDAGVTFSAWSSTGGVGTNRTITCGAGETCDVEVRAVNALGAGDAASDTAVAAELPSAPTNVVVETGTTSGTVDASWDAPSTSGTPALTQYSTRYSTDAGATFSVWSNTGTTATTRTISCGAGETCLVQVRAVNSIGSGASGSDSGVAADVPGVLTSFSASLNSGNADLAWSLGSSFPAITDIEFRVSTDSGTTWGSWTSLGTTGTTASVTACSANSSDTCDYQVRAVNAIGAGSGSATSGFTIP